MSLNLSRSTKGTLVHLPLASGGTDPNSDVIDMQGFEGCVFTGNLGTAGSTDTCTLAIEGSTASGGSYVAITGATQTSTAGLDDKLFSIDVFRPRTRFIRAALTRSAAVEYGGTVAMQYGAARSEPTTWATSTAVSTGTPSVLVVPQTT